MTTTTPRTYWPPVIADDVILSAAIDAFTEGQAECAGHILAALSKPGGQTPVELAELAASYKTAPDEATRRLVLHELLSRVRGEAT